MNETLKGFLRLIRIQNLFIVIITQYFMRYFIMEPMLGHFPLTVRGIVQNYELELQMSSFDFFLLVMAWVFLTAAGYVINDYFDIKIDRFNRPGSVIVGNSISRKTSLFIHWVFNVIAVLLGFYVSWKIGIYQLGFVYLIITGVLWFYTTSYKKLFLIGNLIVAFLTSLVPFVVVLYELPLLNNTYGSTLIRLHADFNNLFFWVVIFSGFAFITTLIREIVKDAEDFEGDMVYGGHTLPIVLGIKWTKTLITVLSVLTVSVVIFLYFTYLKDLYSGIYIGFLIVFPLVLFVLRILTAKEQKHYHTASNLMKIIMLLGIMYSVLVWYIINNI